MRWMRASAAGPWRRMPDINIDTRRYSEVILLQRRIVPNQRIMIIYINYDLANLNSLQKEVHCQIL
jgi:hypothetical protein